MEKGDAMKKLEKLTELFFCTSADDDGRCGMEQALFNIETVGVSRIGRSILGREINSFSVGRGKGRVAIFGAHHALEHITANILYAFVYAMADASFGLCSTVGLDRGLLFDSFTYHVIPCVNPDGVQMHLSGCGEGLLLPRQTAMSGGDYSGWQANGRGVDLNHNYDFGFGAYKQIERQRNIMPGASLFSGEYPESEPESYAVAAFIRALAPIAVVSLHSQGEEIYVQPRDSKALKLGQRLSDLTGYTLSVPTDTARYGGLCDYTGALGIPSFTYEVGRGKNPLPTSDARRIFLRIYKSLVLLPTLV